MPLYNEVLHIITKMRPDRVLRHLYHWPKNKSKGSPKLYDGKVDCKNIGKHRIKQFVEHDGVVFYRGIVYWMALKMLVWIASL